MVLLLHTYRLDMGHAFIFWVLGNFPVLLLFFMPAQLGTDRKELFVLLLEWGGLISGLVNILSFASWRGKDATFLALLSFHSCQLAVKTAEKLPFKNIECRYMVKSLFGLIWIPFSLHTLPVMRQWCAKSPDGCFRCSECRGLDW